MRAVRRAIVPTLAAALAIACGLDVVGVQPEAASVPGDAASDRAVPDAPPPVELDATAEADADAAVDAGCIYQGGFCNPCDPQLVLCVEFDGDGGIVDRSGYHRAIVVNGTPQYTSAEGRTAIALDGSVEIRVPYGPGLDIEADDTVEVVTRLVKAPASGARSGIIDRNSGGAIFVYGEPAGVSASCRDLRTQAGGWPSSFQRVTCVTTRDRKGTLYLGGSSIGQSDTARNALPLDENEPFLIGRNSPSGDVYVGDIASIRIYTRAKSAEEVADGGP